VAGGLAFASLALGEVMGCGITTPGDSYCWGKSGLFAPGFNSLTPVAVAQGLLFTQISVASDHVCGLTSAGAAYCWGGGYLGDGSSQKMTWQATPVAVSGGLVLKSLASGRLFTCGLTTDGTLYCWGSNGTGLGDGTYGPHAVPTRIPYTTGP
jgi:alpha-tubulin suppressor-like RCC1 family protein